MLFLSLPAFPGPVVYQDLPPAIRLPDGRMVPWPGRGTICGGGCGRADNKKVWWLLAPAGVGAALLLLPRGHELPPLPAPAERIPPSAAVSEPGALALLGFGLLMISRQIAKGTNGTF